MLVMEAGRCVEFGPPDELVQNDGYFSTLVDAAGPQAALQLRAEITQAAARRAQRA